VLTVTWAVEAVARLGGYLEHRQKKPHSGSLARLAEIGFSVWVGCWLVNSSFV